MPSGAVGKLEAAPPAMPEGTAVKIEEPPPSMPDGAAAAASASIRSSIVLLQGPPGTGKSTTIFNGIKYRLPPQKQAIVAAVTNHAVAARGASLVGGGGGGGGGGVRCTHSAVAPHARRAHTRTHARARE